MLLPRRPSVPRAAVLPAGLRMDAEDKPPPYSEVSPPGQQFPPPGQEAGHGHSGAAGQTCVLGPEWAVTYAAGHF